MSSELKPLYANLRKVDVSNYLIEKAFMNSLIELDLDEEWHECLEEFTLDPLSLSDDYEEAFFDLLKKCGNKYLLRSESDELIIDLILDFYDWSPVPLDYYGVYDSLKDYGVDRDLLKFFSREVRKINSQKRIRPILMNKTKKNIKNVFLVHGHDKVSRLELSKLLKEELGLNPIVLQESPNEGLDTIVSKFERLAGECASAIVLLTPDDKISEGGFRSRQNVIFELGYFLGRDQLNEDRQIIILRKGQVEIPSDISGVLYLDFSKSVNEVFLDLQKQLKHWKILP